MAVEEAVPEIVAGAVEAKTTDILGKMAELQDQFKSVLEDAKFSDAGKSANREEQVNLTAKIFKGVLDGEEIKTLTNTTDSTGGYLVPDEFSRDLVREVELQGVARRYCRIIPMSTNAKDVPALAGSVTAYVVGGGVAITASNPTFGNAQLVARKFGVLVHAWNELIDDNMSNQDIFDLVIELASEAFATLEDTQVFTGDGTGTNFEGILTNADVNVVTMATGDTSFEDITYDYLVSVVKTPAMKYKRGKKPIWVMSQDVFAHILKLKDTTGRPIVVGDPKDPIGYRLLGFDVELTDVMPTDADDAVSTKFLIFGDLRYYGMGDRKATTVEEGYHDDQFGKDIKSLRIIERVAGITLIGAGLTVLKTAAS